VYEAPYIDRHFSEDFGGYYVRCFGQYRKQCARIHFFGSDFSQQRVEQLLVALTPSKDISDELNYLGFVVVKPLPETVVGRTCLKQQQALPKFPTLRQQKVNFFGIDLEFDSLPFQEQDNEVAACATSALWSVLQGTAKLFEHKILTPLEIT